MKKKAKNELAGFSQLTFLFAGALMILTLVGLNIFSPEFRALLTQPVGIKSSSSAELLGEILPQTNSLAKKRIAFNPTPAPTTSSLPHLSSSFLQLKELEKKSQSPFVKILISEILFGSQGQPDAEYVELYNPSDFSVELAGWELRKKTRTGSDSVLVSAAKFSGVIPAQGYFLISHPSLARELTADLVWSSSAYSLTEDNTIYLVDAETRQVDLVGCGQAPSAESRRCQFPEPGVSVSRVAAKDTDNNEADFSFSFPTPQNSSQRNGFLSPRLLSELEPAMKPSPSVSSLLSPTLVLFSSPTPVLLTPSPSPSLVVSPFLFPLPSPSSIELKPAQIIKVQFGLAGRAEADFVELYNPNPAVLDLKPYKLFNKTANGLSSKPVKSWSRDSDQALIPPESYFYWVNSSYQEKINELTERGARLFTTAAELTKGVVLQKDGVTVAEVDNLD